MNIIFQFGEFFTEGGSKTNFTVWIPVITFIAGFIINNRVKRTEVLKDAIEAKTYLLTSSQSLIKAITDRAKSIEDFHLQVKDKSVTSIFKIKDTLGFHLKNIDFIDRGKIYSSLITNQGGDMKLKAEALNDFYNRIEKLRVIIDKHDERIKEFFEKSDLRANEIDESIRIIQDLYVRTILSEGIKSGQADMTGKIEIKSPLLQRIDKIVADWQSHPNFRNYSVKNSLLIVPLQNIIREKRLSEFILELTKPVMNAVSNYILYEQNRMALEHYLKVQKIILLTSSRKIIKSYNFLYSQKVKTSWFGKPTEEKFPELKRII